jgi:hypothetical protein
VKSFVAPTGSLPSEDTAVVLLCSLVASGHIRLRSIDGWQKIATVLRQQTPRAADEAASPQLSLCVGFGSAGEDPGATLHGLARYQGEADPLVDL